MSEALVDTNVVVKHLRKKPHVVTEYLAGLNEAWISERVFGELYFGAYHGAQPERESVKIEKFLESTATVFHDEATARIYGKIAAQVALDGKMIPTNDLWIAAIAIECDLPLATLDRPFDRVEGLRVSDWSTRFKVSQPRKSPEFLQRSAVRRRWRIRRWCR